MSDCSTESMKPKEPPKTCGTCGWFALEPDKQRSGACMGSYDSDSCAYRLTNVHVREYRYPWCAGWRTKKPDCDACPERLPEDACKVKARCYDMQQRCQQLEQVARDMLNYLSEVKVNASPLRLTKDTEAFRKRLEALGVSVDG